MKKCLQCGKKVSPKSMYCERVKGKEDCSYVHRRALALAGKIPPTRMLICPVCGDEYPYYAVLQNRFTCSTTSGSDCSKKRTTKNVGVAMEKRKIINPPHHLNDACRRSPLCVNFLTCESAGFPDYKPDGSCYHAPIISRPVLQRGIDTARI